MTLTKQEHLVDKLLYLRNLLEANGIPQHFIDHISVNVCLKCQYEEAERSIPVYLHSFMLHKRNREAIFCEIMGLRVHTVPSGACIQCH